MWVLTSRCTRSLFPSLVLEDTCAMRSTAWLSAKSESQAVARWLVLGQTKTGFGFPFWVPLLKAKCSQKTIYTPISLPAIVCVCVWVLSLDLKQEGLFPKPPLNGLGESWFLQKESKGNPASSSAPAVNPVSHCKP